MALINVSTRYVKHNHYTPPLSLSLYFFNLDKTLKCLFKYIYPL